MPFVKGTPKPPNSGRKKGSLNRETVQQMLDALGCNPIESMVRLARAHEEKNPTLAGRLYAELAQYTKPKLRAVEHSGPGGTAIALAVDPYEAIERELARLHERGRADEVPAPIPNGHG